MPEAETWLYAGQKQNGASKSDVWIDGDEKRMLFKAGRTVYAVGHEYLAQVTREDGSVILHGQPSYVGPHHDSTRAAQLQAEYKAAYGAIRRAALEKDAKKANELDDALAPLIAIASTMSRQDRDMFIAFVIRKIHNAWAS